MATFLNIFFRRIAALRGALNPHVSTYTFRFLRSVRLALHPEESVLKGNQ